MGRSFWWLEEPGSVAQAQAVFAAGDYLASEANDIEQVNIRYHRLYAGMQGLGGLMGFTDAARAALVTNNPRLSPKGPAYNIVQSCCDTVTAKIGGNTPKPMFLTSGGSYQEQLKAKKLDKFVSGVFYLENFDSKAARTFLDGTISGTGILKVYAEDDDICMDKVFINELLIDEFEGIYGEPQNYIQRKYIQKDQLCALYPDFEEYIRAAPTAGDVAERRVLANMVLVLEAWHLPTTDDSGDGYHLIAIPTCVLSHDAWERCRPPFAFIRWNTRPVGFWGQGLAEQLQSLQMEINRVLMVISASHKIMSVPRVWLDVSSKINKSTINNEIGGIGTYSGQPPIAMNWSAVSPELVQYLESLYNKAFEISGISQLSAQSRIPQGIKSGKAIDTYHDIETERFQVVGREYERFVLDVTRLVIDAAKEIGNVSVKAPGSRFSEEIKWKDVNLPEEAYVMKIYPTNMLSDSPSERLQEVQDLTQAGFIPPEEARRLLDFPDLEAANDLDNAMVDNIAYYIDRILEDGDYIGPNGLQDPALAKRMFLAAKLRGEISGLEQEKLNDLQQWMDALDAQEAMKQQAAMASAPTAPGGLPGQPPPGGPQSVPAPPPVSQLLPNVPGGNA